MAKSMVVTSVLYFEVNSLKILHFVDTILPDDRFVSCQELHFLRSQSNQKKMLKNTTWRFQESLLRIAVFMIMTMADKRKHYSKKIHLPVELTGPLPVIMGMQHSIGALRYCIQHRLLYRAKHCIYNDVETMGNVI